MIVAHLFNSYLKNTENWCYRMIASLINVEICIVTDTCLDIGKFPLPSAKFLIPKYSEQLISGTSLLKRMLKRISRFFWFRFSLPTHLKQVDLMHAHFSFVGWDYLSLSRKLDIPMIVSFYGFDYESLPHNQPEWRDRYAVLFVEATLVLAEGNAGKLKLVDIGCPENKVRVAHLGVNVQEIPFILRAKESRSLRLVQIATFTGKKGHLTTVKAFARGAARFPNMDLTLVGKDPEGLRSEIEKIIEEFGLVDRVTLIDGIDFSTLHEYLQNFHVFIHPSKHTQSGDCEGGAPIVLLDAQATGMPVLSTTHCDIPEEVAHGITGFLVAEEDDESLSEAIGKFYHMDETEYHGYCRNARKHVEENYDVTRCAEQLRDIYADIINQSSKLRG